MRVRTSADVIAIDGKTLRRGDAATGKQPIHMVSAWAVANGMLMGQKKITDHSNEITAIPAMGCQEAIAKKIRTKKADYVFSLKGNQGMM